MTKRKHPIIEVPADEVDGWLQVAGVKKTKRKPPKDKPPVTLGYAEIIGQIDARLDYAQTILTCADQLVFDLKFLKKSFAEYERRRWKPCD